MLIQEPVQAAIWHCLNLYDYKDAVFLSERLCAEVETDETIFLLATSYFRSNMIHQCYHLLKEKNKKSPQCKFLLAKCAYNLKLYAEAEGALSSICLGDSKNFDDVVKEFGEIACFALQLIGKICSQTERLPLARDAYKKCLKLNPFLWNVFTDLCNLGDQIDPNSVFHFRSHDIFNTCQGNNDANIVMMPSFQVNTNDSGSQLNSSLILSTPVDQMITPSNNNNNNTLNNSLVILRGGTVPLQNNCGIIEETPLHPYGSADSNMNIDGGTPLRRFKYLNALSPITPSFGILPLNSPCSDTQSLNGNVINSTTPSPQTLVENNQESKMNLKKLKSHLITRKDSGVNNTNNKSNVFAAQTGNTTPRAPNNTGHTGMGGQNVRRSSRLFTNSNNYSVKENTKSPNINKFVQPRSPPRRSKLRITKLNLNEVIEKDKKNERETLKERIETITSTNESKVLFNNSLNTAQTMAHHVLSLRKQSADGLMSLLRELGQGFQLLSQYKCKEAIECLESSIPVHQLNTSWVQSLIGLAYYELTEYEKSCVIFRKIHEQDPKRLEYMDIFSSCLWHLQKETEISCLAQDLIAQNKTSPVTWCVAGNCFSLHREHDTAIKFFRRAVQVDPDFVYCYTLLGHELVLTEELDKAMSSFRTAMMKNSRHYNAWFGMGTIYSKQEKYDLAEIHFKQAFRLNPRNSVILVHIGVMQFYQQKKEKALETLSKAVALDPKNPLAKFHRATLFLALGKYQDALKELEELKEIVPKESVVFYYIGKIHKQLGHVDLALMHFSWATDLDPKGANNQVKDVFDSGNNDDSQISSDGADIMGISSSMAAEISSRAEFGELEQISEEESVFNSAEFDGNYESD